jgi:hypothetical protein
VPKSSVTPGPRSPDRYYTWGKGETNTCAFTHGTNLNPPDIADKELCCHRARHPFPFFSNVNNEVNFGIKEAGMKGLARVPSLKISLLMKWLARVPSPSLLLFKVHFIINVGKKEMDPFCFIYSKETKNHVASPRAWTVTYLSYSTLFHWG